MRITKNHLDYWREKKASAPAWASGLPAAKGNPSLVNRLINSQAEVRDSRDQTFVIHRTLQILRSQQKRGGLPEFRKGLLSMSREPGARGVMCKRWLDRISHRLVDHRLLAESLLSNMDGFNVAEILSEHLHEPVHFWADRWRFDSCMGVRLEKESMVPFMEKALKKMRGHELEELAQGYDYWQPSRLQSDN